jgi:segregation and condensation protein A
MAAMFQHCDHVPTVSIGGFEGPLDQLWEKAKTDQHLLETLSLTPITEQLIDYVKSMSVINLTAVGQALNSISHLMLLKSQWLLPQPEVATEGTAEVQHYHSHTPWLEERRIFHAAAAYFSELVWDERESFARSNYVASHFVGTCDPLPVSALAAAMSEQIAHWTRSQAMRIAAPVFLRIEAAIRSLRRAVEHLSGLSFTHFVRSQRLHRREVVVHFLAVLELARDSNVRVHQNAPFTDIVVEIICSHGNPQASQEARRDAIA